MTDKITLADNNIKSFVFYDICVLDVYPYEKVVFKHTGFRSEDEDGFAYKYTVSDYENPDRIHTHRSLKQISVNQQDSQFILDEPLNEECDDRICSNCRADHSFRDVRTFIDMLPELFPGIFKNSSSDRINKLQELVN
jgi:hypothetical protein